MTQTPEEIAKDLYMKLPLNLAMALPGPQIARIAATIREAEERGRKASSVDANECGLWCPNCGAHLRAPGS